MKRALLAPLLLCLSAAGAPVTQATEPAASQNSSTTARWPSASGPISAACVRTF